MNITPTNLVTSQKSPVNACGFGDIQIQTITPSPKACAPTVPSLIDRGRPLPATQMRDLGTVDASSPHIQGLWALPPYSFSAHCCPLHPIPAIHMSPQVPATVPLHRPLPMVHSSQGNPSKQKSTPYPVAQKASWVSLALGLK